MTAIATFTYRDTSFLIADTLLTNSAIPAFKISTEAPHSWLSTGVRVEYDKNISEGLLKIWTVQENLGIAYAGDVRLATEALSMMVEQAKHKPFTSYKEFHSFISTTVLQSVGPFAHKVILCGFFIDPFEHIKFRCTFETEDSCHVNFTADKDTTYAAGSGEKILLAMISQLKSGEVIDKPEEVISTLGDRLYIEQFLYPENLVFKRFTGGAITGVYASKTASIGWPAPRTILTFRNIGGTGLDVNWQWHPLIYKIWHCRNNILSLASFEQDNKWWLRLTVYSNKLSDKLNISEMSVLEKLLSFNSPTLTLLLIPRYEPPLNQAHIYIDGPGPIFKEEIIDGQIRGLFIDKEALERLRIDEVSFIKSDGVVAFNADAYKERASWIKERLQKGNVPKTDCLSYIQARAVALLHLGYNFGELDLEALSDGLSAFIDAYEFCLTENLGSLKDAIHNLRQTLEDLKRRCPADDVARILEGERVRLALIHGISI